MSGISIPLLHKTAESGSKTQKYTVHAGPVGEMDGRKSGIIPHQLLFGDQTVTDPLQYLFSYL